MQLRHVSAEELDMGRLKAAFFIDKLMQLHREYGPL